MRRLPVCLSLLSVSCAYAQLSFNLNVGLSDISFETEAAIVVDYNEVDTAEAIDSYKSSHPYEKSVISALNTGDTNGNILLSHIFTKGSNAGTDWADSTDNVHLLKYTKADGSFSAIDGVQAASTHTVLTFTDIVLTSTATPVTPVPADASSITADWDAKASDLDPQAGVILKLRALGGMVFEYKRPSVNDADTTTEDQEPIYTTASISTTDQPADSTTAWNDLSDNAFKARISYAVIMSTSEYEAMENLKDMLEKGKNTVGTSAIYGEEHFDYLDIGMDAVYDYGDVDIFLSANAHYPLPLSSRSTTELIKFNPGASVDASFGAMISYGQGKFGLSAGVAQMRGDYILSPLEKTYTEFPKTTGTNGETNGTTTSFTLPAEYINHTQSYTSGTEGITIKDINEPLYFAEIKAEGAPLYDGGLSVYGKFRIALSEDNSDALKRLRITQDTVSVGARFNAFYM